MKIDYLKLNENLEEPFNETKFIFIFLITLLITTVVFIIFLNIFIGINIFLSIPESLFMGTILSSTGLITFSDCFYNNDYNTEYNKNIMKKYNVEDINFFRKNIDFIYNKIDFALEISDKDLFVNNILNIIYNNSSPNNPLENEIVTELNNTGI